MQNTTIEQKLELLLNYQEEINRAIELLKTEQASEEINNELNRRHSLSLKDALLEFGLKQNIYSPEDSVDEIQNKLFVFLQSQPILDFIILYDEEGFNFMNKFVIAILSIE